MANPRPQNIEEDDPDILALRAEALSSLISKEKKKVHIQQSQIHAPHLRPHFQPLIRPLQIPPQRFPPNGRFGGPAHMELGPSPVRQPIFNNQPIFHPIPRPTFAPRQPPFIPGPPVQMMPVHLNPNFVPQRPAFTPQLQTDEDMPMLSDSSSFEPTPPSRLSPRSAKFVAENEKALQRQKQQRRSSSSDRSRSRSPYNKYRRRSRSPVHKVDHIVRKRTRSNTPEKNGFRRKSRSPARRQDKRGSPKFRGRGGFRGNGNRNSRIENGTPKKFPSPPKPMIESTDEEMKVEDEAKVVKEKSPAPAKAATSAPKKSEPTTKREKTEQEIEDELLASTDDEKSENGDDEDVFKMTLSDDDLDFLKDDEEESENEGRFKSKPTTELKKPTTAVATSNYKPAYSKGFDKNINRYDYKRDMRRDRDRRNSPKDEKRYSSPSRKNKKLPEPRKSPEVSRKIATKEPEKQSKIVILNKEKKVEAEKPKAVELKTKTTFELSSEDKKKDEAPKKEERIRLVRSSIVNRIEPPKKSEKPKEGKVEKPILKRLGPYISETSKKPLKASWAKDQIMRILCENLGKDVKVG